MDIYNSQHTKEHTYIQIYKSNRTLYNYCNNKHEFSSNEPLHVFEYTKKIEELLLRQSAETSLLVF